MKNKQLKKVKMSNYILKDDNKRKLFLKNELKRLQYKYVIKNQTIDKQTRTLNIIKLNKLNRNSCKTRVTNRCILTGRSRAVYKLFRLSRIKFRELAVQGFIPGVTKASW